MAAEARHRSGSERQRPDVAGEGGLMVGSRLNGGSDLSGTLGRNVAVRESVSKIRQE
jgi:hypothetical protein